MINWAKYWTLYPKTICETDFLKQVGKTICGQNISYQQFRSIILGIEHHLDLKEADVVLDLCCGNGLITKEIGKLCKEVVGVDFSYTLLKVANKYHRPRNVSYKHISVLELDKLSTTFSGSFNKVLMYEALQHFKKRDLIIILRNIILLSSEDCVILFGSVPDRRRKWNFYNTAERRTAYIIHKIFSREAIGTWWDKQYIRKLCEQQGLQCEFHEQSRDLHTSHYRFDVKIF